MQTAFVKVTVNDVPSVVKVEYSKRQRNGVEIPWVRIEHVRLQAPGPEAVAAVLLSLKTEDGKYVIDRDCEPDSLGDLTFPTPTELKDRKIGFTNRVGMSGAHWGHAWFLTEDGYKDGQWIACYHESMNGKCNEPVEGHPYVLLDSYMISSLNTAVHYDNKIKVQPEAKPVPALCEPIFSVSKRFVDSLEPVALSEAKPYVPPAAEIPPPPVPSFDDEQS